MTKYQIYIPLAATAASFRLGIVLTILLQISCAIPFHATQLYLVSSRDIQASIGHITIAMVGSKLKKRPMAEPCFSSRWRPCRDASTPSQPPCRWLEVAPIALQAAGVSFFIPSQLNETANTTMLSASELNESLASKVKFPTPVRFSQVEQMGSC
nr:hypothetical protein L203_04555 [Cryptococcus depauperatus CBS 7841]